MRYALMMVLLIGLVGCGDASTSSNGGNSGGPADGPDEPPEFDYPVNIDSDDYEDTCTWEAGYFLTWRGGAIPMYPEYGDTHFLSADTAYPCGNDHDECEHARGVYHEVPFVVFGLEELDGVESPDFGDLDSPIHLALFQASRDGESQGDAIASATAKEGVRTLDTDPSVALLEIHDYHALDDGPFALEIDSEESFRYIADIMVMEHVISPDCLDEEGGP